MQKHLYAIVQKVESFLKDNGIADARISSEELLRSVLKLKTRSELYLYDGTLTRVQVKTFFSMARRRSEQYPLQYITGEAGFRNHVFTVHEAVLIPRPETEIVVDAVISFLKTKNKPTVLDIGTGSGCIAISVASEVVCERVVALDVSPDALTCAQQNAIRLGLSTIDFIVSDCFQSVSTDMRFDCIVSNPPYIKSADLQVLQQEVQHEPVSALDGGTSGVDLYSRIIERAPHFLRSGGMIFFEIGCDQAQDVCTLLRAQGFQNCNVLKDLAGKDRIVSAQKE